jgi:hypothetical protein
MPGGREFAGKIQQVKPAGGDDCYPQGVSLRE